MAPFTSGSDGDAEFQWVKIARMPASNHDISGAELDGKLYVAGGCTKLRDGSVTHAFDEVWELTPRTWEWRVAAKLSRKRIYCYTATFEGRIWIAGGDILEEDGSRRAVGMVELYDPKHGGVALGPENLFPRPMPLALAVAGRLYVMGNARGEFDLPGKMESIGAGETQWRREPDGPPGMGPLAGAALEGKLYVTIPKTGLAIFDAVANGWEVIARPSITRSCQMAAYGREIWMMGGRDGEDGRLTWIYSPARGEWRLGPALPEPLAWGAAGVVGEQLIVTGGAWGQYYSDATYALIRSRSHDLLAR